MIVSSCIHGKHVSFWTAGLNFFNVVVVLLEDFGGGGGDIAIGPKV
jgi:hypothetical protein